MLACRLPRTRLWSRRRSRPTEECKSCIPSILTNLVFRIEDKVPALHKVSSKILNDRAAQSNRNIRPSHARHGQPIELVLLPLPDVVEVEYTGVVVILAREDSFVDVGRVYIGECMLMGVPPAEAHVQTAHESDLTVNEAQFFVMGPV